MPFVFELPPSVPRRLYRGMNYNSAQSLNPSSSGSSGTEWIGLSKEVVKHVIAVGESLPFPYLKGAGLMALVILETIEVR